MPANVPVEVPHALDMQRETGLVALRSAKELGLSVESAFGLHRVDVEESTRLSLSRDEAGSGTQTGADKTGRLFSAFRFARLEFALRVRVDAIQSRESGGRLNLEAAVACMG